MRVRGQIQPRFEHLSGYIEFWLRFIWPVSSATKPVIRRKSVESSSAACSRQGNAVPELLTSLSRRMADTLHLRTSKPVLAPEPHCSSQRSIDCSSPREPVQPGRTPPSWAIVRLHNDRRARPAATCYPCHDPHGRNVRPGAWEIRERSQWHPTSRGGEGRELRYVRF
jgi:hypothetical protein